jgi:hypothetical protein
MSYFVNRRPRVVGNSVLLVKRQLLGKGQIIAKIGQEVFPSDIIGRGATTAGFRNINLAKMLGVSPKQAAEYLDRPLKQRIYKDELLAFKKGGFLNPKKVITSPTDGVLDSYNDSTGELRISFLPHPIELPAAVFGVVEKIDQIKAEVIIKTQATAIYGILGTGRSREGSLKVIGGRSDLTDKARMPTDLAKHILVSGGLIYTGALAQAVASGVHGIITGGINSLDYKSISGGRLNSPAKFVSDIGLAIVVTEGFGSIPIGEDIFNILTSFNNQFVIIDGNRGKIILPSCQKDCMLNIRKVSLPPQALERFVEPSIEIEATELRLGQRVRVIASPNMGEQGDVMAIDNVPSLLESQIRTIMVTVETKSRKIKVPYSNLEVIN